MDASSRASAKIKRIDYLSEFSEVNPENDNIDILVVLEDGREFTFILSTPNNVYWCMENEGIDYFFGEPILFVKHMTKENIENALKAIITEDNGRWLSVYG